MPTGNAKFQAAADAAACQFLAAAGSGAASFTAYSLLTGQLWAGGLGAAVTGIAAYAFAQNCQWDSGTPEDLWEVTLSCCPPNVQDGVDTDYWRYSVYDTVGKNVITRRIGTNFGASQRYDYGELRTSAVPGNDGTYFLRVCSGSGTRTGNVPGEYFEGGRYTGLELLPPSGYGCDPAPPSPPPDYVYTDPDDGCQINVSFQGWGVEPDGTFRPVWQMDPILPPAARATGGVIGGCNFTPVIYYGGPPDRPRDPIPVPPYPTPGPNGEPWWLPALKWGASAVGNAVVDALYDDLVETKYPTGSRSIYAACEYKQDGTKEEFSVTFPEESWKNRVLTGLDAITDFQQQILYWKTPTCGGSLPGQTGTPYTINWVSDELNDHGNSLRKEFRYFDQSGKDLGEHFLHWKDFTWQAGPIFVGTEKTPLGKTHVWAESEAEGRRVIEHAATIAGVTLPDDSWSVSVSRGGRVGQPGTMRLQRSDGRYWISTRKGPSGPPSYPAA